ncbi:MAG TPA: hypothetical protein PLS03_13880 [Terrimicrobiaceae bacterium]|nr:hypothetical protein [Terrimicrobiaceae bacterium]
MLTPKLYRRLEEIFLQESLTPAPGFSIYLEEALQGKSVLLDDHFRISTNGRLEAARPSGSKAYAVRLQTRTVIRVITRAARAEIPVGAATKEWMQSALRDPDYRREVENCLQDRPRQP